MLRWLKHLLVIIILIAIPSIPLYIHFQNEIHDFFHEVLQFENKCSINIENLDENSSIFLTKDNQFKIPNNLELKWDNDAEITQIICNEKGM
jgi:hypothetical protein